MTDDPSSLSRAFLAQFLPKALRICTDNYQRCLHNDHDNTAKDFKEYHLSGKAAVSHLAALVKLMDHCASTSCDTPSDISLDDLLRRTRTTLMNHHSLHEPQHDPEHDPPT